MKQFLKVTEVAENLNASRRTVLRWIREGKLRAVRHGDGRLWRISEDDFRRFAKGQHPKSLI
jgi:excisionase family DNA binding protein